MPSPFPPPLPAAFPVITGEAAPARLKGAVVAIGNFDGVHRGHCAVIGEARRLAAGGPALVLTFEPHPRAYFCPEPPLFRLADVPTRLRLLANTRIDGVVLKAFDAALASLDADAFVDQVLVGQLAVAGVVVGEDFHFGRGRLGTPDKLRAAGKAHGFAVSFVPPLIVDGTVASSSVIRARLAEGDVAGAARLIGRPWFVSGEVVHGEKRGRELSFPTANLALDPGCRLAHGIYAVKVGIGARVYDGVASFGRRPTFDNGAPLLETFIFDFAGDLYGQTIEVAFIDFIRPELKFDGLEALVAAMNEDVAKAKAILAR